MGNAGTVITQIESSNSSIRDSNSSYSVMHAALHEDFFLVDSFKSGSFLPSYYAFILFSNF